MLIEQRGRRCVRAELEESDPTDARLHGMETRFLVERLRSLQSVRDAHYRVPDTAGQDDREVPAGRHTVGDARRHEAELLLELQAAPERGQRHLECLLGDRLRVADRRASRRSGLAAQRGTCDDACWAGAQERQVLAKILSDWWHWLRRTIKDAGDDSRHGGL